MKFVKMVTRTYFQDNNMRIVANNPHVLSKSTHATAQLLKTYKCNEWYILSDTSLEVRSGTMRFYVYGETWEIDRLVKRLIKDYPTITQGVTAEDFTNDFMGRL